MAEQEILGGVSHREFAKGAGLTHSYVSRLVREKKIPTLPSGKLDPVAAKAGLELNTNLLAVRKGGEDYRRALTARTALQAEKLRRDLKERDGELINKQDILDLWSTTASECKLRLRNIPTRMALRLSVETSPPVIQGLLLAEIDLALTAISDRLEDFFRTWGQHEKKAK